VAGIRAHRVRHLPQQDLTLVEGVPVTNPSRTILDISGSVALRDLEQAIARAEREGMTNRAELLMLLRRPRRKGFRALSVLLNAGVPLSLTRSPAEERLLLLVRRAQLPPPELNVSLGAFEVDFLWRMRRVVVEVDGFAHHASRKSFEGDRRRDARLAADGYRVIRFTWRQLETEPEAVLVQLAQTLARAESLPQAALTRAVQ
jgi:very-short-patch-repair endonuclease